MTTLRIAHADGDAAAVAAIYNPIITDSATSFETVELTVAEMADRIDATMPTWPWLVAEHDGAVLGYAYGTRHRARAAYAWSTEVSVYLDVRARRQGIGTALYVALLELLAAQGYANAYAGITLPNPASAALHESVGFSHIGTFSAVGHKHGRWWDVGWWQLPLHRGDTQHPTPPRDLTALDGDVVTGALTAGQTVLDRRSGQV